MSEPGYKETLENDIAIEFSSNPRSSNGTREISQFAASVLKEGKLTAIEISEAFLNGILGPQTPPTVDTPE